MPQTTPQDISFVGSLIGTTLTQIGVITLNGLERRISLYMNNVGGTALSTFTLTRQYVPEGPFVPWLGGTDFGTATTVLSSSVLNTSVTPTLNAPQSLSAGAIAWVDFDAGAVVAVGVNAQVAGGSTLIDMNGAAQLWPQKG